ncbi:helix-turn-helix domain-containing protein [Maritalea sp.]|uniref:helix-turn-helix domain-containing protein n=1 Tax=Maritalea sp. TaxID=2003361 RepID=UPI003EF3DE9B
MATHALAPHLSPKHVRENCRINLERAVQQLGSASRVADAMGINRSQLSRYLSGSTVPRIETLFTLARTMGVSMEWFLLDHRLEPNLTGRDQFARSMSQLIRGREFQITEDLLEDGFYMFWKGLWGLPNRYEALFSKIIGANGTKNIRTSMIRPLRREKLLDAFYPGDLMCEGVLIRSAGGITSLFADTPNNVLVIGYLEKQERRWEFGGNAMYCGNLTVHLPQTEQRPSMVPFLIEKVAPKTSTVLQAARSVDSYEFEDLPERVKFHIENMQPSRMHR